MRIASDGAAFLFAALLFCLSSLTAAAQTSPPSTPPTALKPVTVGRTTVAWSASVGLTVAVDSVPVVTGSTLRLVKKGMGGGVLLDQRHGVPRVLDWKATPDGGKTANVAIENDAAACGYDLTVSRVGDTDAVTIDLTYRLKQDFPAEIESAAYSLSGPVLQGAALSGPEGGPINLQVVSVNPPPLSNSPEQNRLSPPFREATLATRLGPMSISFQRGDSLPILVDARSTPQQRESTIPTFLLDIGRQAVPFVPADGEIHSRFHFTIGTPASPAKTLSKSVLDVTRSPLFPAAYVTPASAMPHTALPPKRAIYPAGAPFRLSRMTKIVPCDSSAGTQHAVTALREAIKERFGFEPAVQLMSAPQSIFVGIAGKSLFLDGRDLGAAARAEGYTIRSTHDALLISGSDDAGVLAGVKTTSRLLSTDRAGAFIRPVLIEDWPTQPSPPDETSRRARPGYALRFAGPGVRAASDWLGYGVVNGPVGLPTGDSRFPDGTIYNVGSGPLLLAGRLDPPGTYPMSAELTSLRGADAKPRTVRLLVAASHEAAEGTQIGALGLRATDGKTHTVPLIYGKNVAAWSDARTVAEAPTVWKGSTRVGQPFYLRRIEVSVAPGEEIDTVSITSVNTESAPAIFGVTFLH
jgi:hypothetical protein